MAGAKSSSGIGSWLAPPRFILFALLFAGATGASIALGQKAPHGLMIGFDVATIAFFLSLIPLFRSSDPDSMRRHAAENDANRAMLLVITGAVMVVILVVVAAELGGQTKGADKALILGTLTLAWLFSNIIYAFHYAHLWYSSEEGKKGDNGGIDFPGTPEPDYWDFVYFAFTLGMTFQTSDMDITDRRLRRLATVHCFAAFIFNLGVIAFTINVLGSSGKG